MGNQVGVFATVGPDPGLTPEERSARNHQVRWEKILAVSKQKLSRIESLIPSADPPARVKLLARVEILREEIARAEGNLLGLVN